MMFLSPLVLVAVWACLPNSECPEFEETTVCMQQAKQHQKLGEYDPAETLLRRVLKTTANESRAMLEALNQLAGVLFLKADYMEAEATVRRALELNSQQAERDDLKQAETQNTLAEILRARDRVSEADVAQRQALATFENQLGKDHPSTLTVLGKPGFSPGPTRPFSRSGDDLTPGARESRKTIGTEQPILGDNPEQPGRL